MALMAIPEMTPVCTVAFAALLPPPIPSALADSHPWSWVSLVPLLRFHRIELEVRNAFNAMPHHEELGSYWEVSLLFSSGPGQCCRMAEQGRKRPKRRGWPFKPRFLFQDRTTLFWKISPTAKGKRRQNFVPRDRTIWQIGEDLLIILEGPTKGLTAQRKAKARHWLCVFWGRCVWSFKGQPNETNAECIVCHWLSH